MNQLKAYIAKIASTFAADRAPVVYSVLAEFGKAYASSTPMAGYMTLGRCYSNCLEKALDDSRYVYAEGFGVAGKIGAFVPLSHAWVVGPDGAAYDPTWGNAKGNMYVGVKFSNDFLCDFTERTGMASVIDSLYALRMSPAAAREYVVSGIIA